MPDMKLLADLVDQASRRHDGASGRQLAEIAKRDGYDVSHSTLNKIRARSYESTPSIDTLRAIAHLANVPEAEVFNAATPDSAWVEFEKVFTAYQTAKSRVFDLTAQYARLRGISVSAASTELEHTSKLYDDFMRGLKNWVPPWAADSAAAGHRDTSAVVVSITDVVSPPIKIAARTEDDPKEDLPE